MKIKRILNNFVSYINNLWGFPHIRMSIVILLIAVGTLLISIYLENKGMKFGASILSNLFAGLMTGLVLCLVGGTKQRTMAKFQMQKEWLEEIAKLLKIYLGDYHQLNHIHFEKGKGREEYFDFYKEMDIHANDINGAIIQSKFNKVLGFNSWKYCKKKLKYDAEKMRYVFRDLHEKVENCENGYLSSADIRQYFEECDYELKKLNSAINKEIRNVDIKIAELQRLII